ncbi:MAG: NUDIX domain-containing protein [Gammaproteobacteria bacterium]|nr:NUDIX domain-containing protein [Gammaproteobacteria bacterium]
MSVGDYVTSAVATLIIKNEKILLGRRFENERFASWQCPGGYLQRGEAVEQAARRLCLQKAGLDIQCLSSGPYSNNIFSDSHHTVTLYIVAEDYQIKNQAVFKDEEAQWSWFALDALPKPLFLPLEKVFEHPLNPHK